MQPGLSTHIFFDQRLHPGHLDTLLSAGARTIEVLAARHHFDYTATQPVREVAAWFRSNDVRAVLHQPIYLADSGRSGLSNEAAQWSRHVAPSLDLVSRDKAHRIAAMDEVKRALESAEQIPFAAAVLHMGLKGSRWDETVLEYSLTAIEHLKAFAGPLGLQLLLENLPNDVATPEHLIYILRTGHFDNVGVCLDVGHLHLMQPLEPSADSGLGEALEVLGGRVGQLHVHDNRGAFAPSASLNDSSDMKDEHLWPGDGAMNWDGIGELMLGLPDAVPAVLEIASGRDEGSEVVVRKAQEFFSSQERRREQMQSR
ncbi:MAG TPA: TIM barrel protein [Chloroflexota bacterium]